MNCAFHLDKPAPWAVLVGVVLAGCGPGAGTRPVRPTVAGRAAYSPAELAAAVDIEDMTVSEDGGQLAFTSNRSGAFELWTLDLRAEAAAPEQRTHFNEHVTGPAYSPDGERLVFECDKGGNETTDLWMLRLLRAGEKEPEQLTNTEDRIERHVTWNPARGAHEIAFESDAREPFHFDITAMNVDTGAVRSAIPPQDESLLAPLWTEDGYLLATQTSDEQHGNLVAADKAGTVRRIEAPSSGIIWALSSLAPSLQLGLAGNDQGFHQLAQVTAQRGAVSLFGPGDWDVEQAHGRLDSVNQPLIALSQNIRGVSTLSVNDGGDQKTASRVLLTGGVIARIAIDRSHEKLFLLREESHHPGEISVIDLNIPSAAGKPKTLVPADLGHVDSALLANTERQTFQSFDGRAIDAWITRPKVPRLGTPPPLIIVVHGGPNSQARPYFHPLVQSLAEAGFTVAEPNYRGSEGYGRAFLDLNNKDWGGGDLNDVLAVVDGLAAQKEIDAARTGITGGSYGGYLTLRAIAAAPGRFKAAVEMYGMADLELDYKLTSGRFGGWYETEMGNPVQNKALFVERSPIHFIDKVTAPLLVLQGKNDTNVPKAESDQIVASLRALHRDVEYTVYPDEGHEFTKRKNRIDSIERTVDFFVRHLRTVGEN